MEELLPEKWREDPSLLPFLRAVSNSYMHQETQEPASDARVKAGEELWQFALEGAGDGVWEYNFQTKESFYSRQYKKILGYEDDEFANTAEEWISRIHPNDLPLIEQTDTDYVKGHITSHQREYRMRHKDGHYLWILDRGMVVNYTEDGKPARMVGTHTDITQRKKTEEELTRLSLVASTNENGVLFTNAEGNILWVNEGFTRITGYTEQEIIGKTPIELFKGDLSDRGTIHRILDAFTSGKSFRAEIIYYRKDGSWFWGRTKGQPIPGNSKVPQYFGIIEDISAEKKQDEEMERLSMIASASTAGIVIFDGPGRVSWCNSSFEQITGFNLGELKGKNILELAFGPETERRAIKRMQEKAERKEDFRDEFIHYRKDRSTFWASLKMQFVRNNSGQIIHFAVVRDITEEKNAQHELAVSQKALRINEERYRNIITNMSLGLVETDTEGRIRFANQSFCKMTGYDPDEIMGEKAMDLLAPDGNENLMKLKSGLRQQGISDVYELNIRNKKGELKWWLVSAAPRYNSTGEMAGTVGITLDITAQKELQQQLFIAREAAENSARAKDLFLANMSHEIRTPMNAILGMSRQLDKTRLDEQQHIFLDTITTAAEHLLTVINDILDMSKIEAGKLSLEHIGFRPREIIRHCIRVMQHRADEKGLQLIKEYDEAISPVMIGDPHRLNQVLLNLVSNAIKFTEKGSVTVSCRLLETTENRQLLRFCIEDTGIGMDEEFQAILFQKFTQEDITIARKYGGTGLGMSISRQLIELMNGSIEVKSKKGAGTAITLRIPFTTGTTDELPGTEKKAVDHSILKGKKILLAEDNEMNRLLAITVLSNHTLHIDAVRNGLEAVEAVKSRPYDLVLMDMQMPVMDGLEATKIIRATGNNIPIIALTANAIKGESERCREAGMNDYVSKPFKEEELVTSMAYWIGEKAKQIAGASPAPPLPPARPVLYDLAQLYQVSNDPEFINQMIGLFIEETSAGVREIIAARDKNDLAGVKASAHRIKPSIDSMGITALYQVIRDIEAAGKDDALKEALDENIRQLQQVIEEVIGQMKARPG